MNRCLRMTIISLVMLMLIAKEAVAQYLDPGFGSILLQGVIAVVGATLATIAIYWRATKDLVRRVLLRNSHQKSDREGDS